MVQGFRGSRFRGVGLRALFTTQLSSWGPSNEKDRSSYSVLKQIRPLWANGPQEPLLWLKSGWATSTRPNNYIGAKIWNNPKPYTLGYLVPGLRGVRLGLRPYGSKYIIVTYPKPALYSLLPKSQVPNYWILGLSTLKPIYP